MHGMIEEKEKSAVLLHRSSAAKAALSQRQMKLSSADSARNRKERDTIRIDRYGFRVKDPDSQGEEERRDSPLTCRRYRKAGGKDAFSDFLRREEKKGMTWGRLPFCTRCWTRKAGTPESFEVRLLYQDRLRATFYAPCMEREVLESLFEAQRALSETDLLLLSQLRGSFAFHNTKIDHDVNLYLFQDIRHVFHNSGLTDSEWLRPDRPMCCW